MPDLTRRGLLALGGGVALGTALPTPTFASPTTQFGSGVNGNLLTTLGYDRIDSARVFLRDLPRGSSWTNVSGASDIRDATDHLTEGGTLWLSYKEQSLNRVNRFFNTMPDLPFKVMCTFHHEPEDNFITTSQRANYRALWRDHAPLMREHGMTPATILMRYSLLPVANRNWRDWWPGDGVVDVCGWDVYRRPGDGNTLAAVANFCANVQNAAASVGLPWGIGECGSRSGTYDNANSTLWAASLRAHLLSRNDIDVACWWDQADCLLTATSAAAWLGV